MDKWVHESLVFSLLCFTHSMQTIEELHSLSGPPSLPSLFIHACTLPLPPPLSSSPPLCSLKRVRHQVCVGAVRAAGEGVRLAVRLLSCDEV